MHTREQKKKRNHWVPQAYLRAFAADSRREKIWAFSKDEGDPQLRPIRNVAVRFYLYSPRNAVGRDYRFEDKLASLEQLFSSPYWMGISTGYVDLQDQCLRKAVSLLAATLYLRNPLRLAATHHIHQSLVGLLSQHAELPESIEIDGKNLELDHTTWSAYRDAGEDEIKRMWLTEIGSAVWLAEIFVKMRWAIIVSDTPTFVTTDNPVVALHPDLRFRGFKNAETKVVLPLSPTRLLWLDNRHSEPDGQYYPARDLAASMNGLLWRESIEHMFSSRHTDQVCVEMLEDAERAGFA